MSDSEKAVLPQLNYCQSFHAARYHIRILSMETVQDKGLLYIFASFGDLVAYF